MNNTKQKVYFFIDMSMHFRDEYTKEIASDPVLRIMRNNVRRNIINIYDDTSFTSSIKKDFPSDYIIKAIDNYFPVTLYLEKEHIRMKLDIQREGLSFYPITDAPIDDLRPYVTLVSQFIQNLSFFSFETKFE